MTELEHCRSDRRQFYITDFDGFNVHSCGELGYVECETIEEAVELAEVLEEIWWDL